MSTAEMSIPLNLELPRFIVYSKDGCPYCEQAKALLTERELSHRVLDLTQDEKRHAFYADTGLHSMPAIFEITPSGEKSVRFVGGYTELAAYLGG